MTTETKNSGKVFAQICVKVPPELKGDAKTAGINMTAVCRNALENEVKKSQGQKT